MSERVAHAQDELAEAVDMAGKRQEIAFDCAYRQIACGLTQGLKELAAGIDREYRETAAGQRNCMHAEAGTQVDCLARQAWRKSKCFHLLGAASDCCLDAAGHPGVHRPEVCRVVFSDRRHGALLCRETTHRTDA